jgi:hypothetical protein
MNKYSHVIAGYINITGIVNQWYVGLLTFYHTVLAKYGLSKRFELRLITEYAKDNFKVGNLNSSTSGLAQFTVGSKIV